MNYTTHHPIRKLSKASDPDPGNLKVTSKSSDGKEKADTNNSYPDYPTYPPEEDIYSNYTEEQEIDPEQTSRLKEPVILSDLINQLDFRKELSADELDIPGTELDDSQEILGSEDEENNYYSLGGDDHDDLDEVGDEGISGA